MAMTDQDVREILRMIDTAGTREIRVETEGFSLHVVIGEVDATLSAGPGSPGASADSPGAAPVGAALCKITRQT